MGHISIRIPSVVFSAAVIEPREVYQPKTPSTSPIKSIDLTKTTNDSISGVGMEYLVNLNNLTPEQPSFLTSCIPKKNEQVIVHVQNSDYGDEEYYTDNEIGPCFYQVMDEGELMIQE